MNHKMKKIFLMILFVIGASFCFGEQISFQIVQHNNSVENVTEEALVIEDALISSFFENGYIVTNSLASLSRNKSGDKKLWKEGMQEALDGGSDYFVQIVLYFTQKESETIPKNIMILDKVDYSLALTKNAKVVDEESWKCDIDVLDPIDLNIVSENLINEIYKVMNA